ncbi:MAG: ABC transporter ATP-binding protein [Lewinella sp.]|nr:ABC transporter ATP-binding protein [Lewinella sp.]
MKIELDRVSKRYRRDWILRRMTLELAPAGRYAVTGPNGSGKSTFLRLLSGHLSPTKGQVRYTLAGRPVPVTDVYQHLSYAAPYIELIEEFTLEEALEFHRRFKPFLADLSIPDLIGLLGLEKARRLPIAYFSSGMKQRVKLALACCSASPLLLLDEPTTNLDAEGADWYRQLVERFATNRLVIVASNVPADYQFCTEEIRILDFK